MTLSRCLALLPAIAALLGHADAWAQQQPQQFATTQPQQPATAQPAQPATDSVVQDARRAYDEGSTHFTSGRYDEALVAFERAYSLRPNPLVLMPILECHDRLGHVPEAIRTLETYLHASPNVRNRALLETRLANLRQRPARVHVLTTPTGARVQVDGRELTQATPTDVELPPGRHTLTATLRGFLPASHEFETLPGTGRDELLLLERDPSARASEAPDGPPNEATTRVPTTSRPTSPVVWVAAGLAGATLLTGTVFGVLALTENNTYDQAPARETRDRGLRYALLSDVSFGVAAASAIFGVVMYIVDRGRPPAPHAATAPTASRFDVRASPGGLVVTF